MSLIHKALKKLSGEENGLAKPSAEHFAGEKKPDWKSQMTPRTIILFALALLSLAFMIYKKVYTSRPPIVIPGKEELQAQQPAAVVPALPEAAPEANKSPEAFVEEGKTLFDAGKYDEALSKYIEASLKNPSDAAILNNIGLIFKKKNDFSQAENYYKRALAIKNDYPECLNNMGVLKAAGGDPLEASIYLKKAIGFDSTYADAYFNLAVLNEGEGNYREAISNYKLFLQYTDLNDESLISKIKERVEYLSE